MSKDKYPSKFSPQMATIVFIILQIFFATRAVLTIGEYLTNMENVYLVKIECKRRANYAMLGDKSRESDEFG